MIRNLFADFIGVMGIMWLFLFAILLDNGSIVYKTMAMIICVLLIISAIIIADK